MVSCCIYDLHAKLLPEKEFATVKMHLPQTSVPAVDKHTGEVIPAVQYAQQTRDLTQCGGFTLKALEKFCFDHNLAILQVSLWHTCSFNEFEKSQ